MCYKVQSHGFTELSKQILWISLVVLPHCITCLLLSLLFVLVVVLMYNVDHSSSWNQLQKFFLPSLDMACTDCILLAGRHSKSWTASCRYLPDWFCSICLSWHKIPPRSSGIPETHLVPPGQPSDLVIEQSGDTISWHLGKGCMGGLALSTLIAANFQTWVNPMEIWPHLSSLPLQPPGKHSVFLN